MDMRTEEEIIKCDQCDTDISGCTSIVKEHNHEFCSQACADAHFERKQTTTTGGLTVDWVSQVGERNKGRFLLDPTHMAARVSNEELINTVWMQTIFNQPYIRVEVSRNYLMSILNEITEDTVIVGIHSGKPLFLKTSELTYLLAPRSESGEDEATKANQLQLLLEFDPKLEQMIKQIKATYESIQYLLK
jgi:hypothetical protein